jgi:hypothetical protein
VVTQRGMLVCNVTNFTVFQMKIIIVFLPLIGYHMANYLSLELHIRCYLFVLGLVGCQFGLGCFKLS